jgi:hypothetical protein
VLTDEAIERIKPHLDYLFERLGAGGDLQQLAEEVSHLARVTPAQVILFVHAIVQASQQQQ